MVPDLYVCVFLLKNLAFRFYFYNFAPDYNIYNLGVTGFDGKSSWYVSMRSDGCILHNLFGRTINWRKHLRSRCLIEVQ